MDYCSKSVCSISQIAIFFFEFIQCFNRKKNYFHQINWKSAQTGKSIILSLKLYACKQIEQKTRETKLIFKEKCIEIVKSDLNSPDAIGNFIKFQHRLTFPDQMSILSIRFDVCCTSWKTKHSNFLFVTMLCQSNIFFSSFDSFQCWYFE